MKRQCILKSNLYNSLVGIAVLIVLWCVSCRPAPDPIASFSAQPRIIELGDTIYFTNKSEYFHEVSWDFGDGTLSQENNPVHIYQTPGDFVPSITAINRRKTNSSSLKITVIEPEYTVKATAISDQYFHFECTTTVPVEWYQDRQPFSDDTSIEKEFDRSDSVKIALMIKGTRYILWDTTLLAIKPTGTEATEEPGSATLPETKPSEKPKITDISLFPLKADINENIRYKCTSEDDIIWDFNGEFISVLKQGVAKFTTPGVKTIILKEKATGQEVKRFVIEIGVDENMAEITNIRVRPLRAFVENEISYSCITQSDVIWDFNGEFTSENKIGTMLFKKPGNKTVKLKDKKNGRVVKTFTLEIAARTTPTEVADILNKLANEGASRKDKNALEKDLYKKCAHGSDTKISGESQGTLQDFIYEIGIQSNDYEKVQLQVDLTYDQSGSIEEIIITDKKRTNLK